MRFFPTMGIWRRPHFFSDKPMSRKPRWRWPNLCLDNSALPPSRRPVLTFCCGDLWRLLVWYLMFKQIKNKQNMFFPWWSHSSWCYSIQPLCSEFRNCGRHLFKTNPSPVFIGKIHILLIKSNSNPIKIPFKSHFCWLNHFFDASTSSAPSACRAGWRSLRSRAKERPRRHGYLGNPQIVGSKNWVYHTIWAAVKTWWRSGSTGLLKAIPIIDSNNLFSVG